MNRNSKIANMSSSVPLEQQPEGKQQEWLNGTPTRGEVTQFVSSYINNEVIPVILNSVGKELFQLRCRNEVLLKIVSDANICTVEEFEELYKKHLVEQTEEVRKRQEKQKSEHESKIVVPNKTIIH